MMLSNAMRDRLRGQSQRTMTDSVQIQREQTTRDSEGDTTVTWVTIATVPGKVGAAGVSPNERIQGGQLTGEMTWLIDLPAETDVTNKDRLVCNGVTYGVVGVQGPTTIEVQRRCICTVVS